MSATSASDIKPTPRLRAYSTRPSVVTSNISYGAARNPSVPRSASCISPMKTRCGTTSTATTTVPPSSTRTSATTSTANARGRCSRRSRAEAADNLGENVACGRGVAADRLVGKVDVGRAGFDQLVHSGESRGDVRLLALVAYDRERAAHLQRRRVAPRIGERLAQRGCAVADIGGGGAHDRDPAGAPPDDPLRDGRNERPRHPEWNATGLLGLGDAVRVRELHGREVDSGGDVAPQRDARGQCVRQQLASLGPVETRGVV